jgi:hypothetical protein
VWLVEQHPWGGTLERDERLNGADTRSAELGNSDGRLTATTGSWFTGSLTEDELTAKKAEILSRL